MSRNVDSRRRRTKPRSDYLNRLGSYLERSAHHRSKTWRDASALLVAAKMLSLTSSPDAAFRTAADDDAADEAFGQAKVAIYALSHESSDALRSRLRWLAHDPDRVGSAAAAAIKRHAASAQRGRRRTAAHVPVEASLDADRLIFASLDRHNHALLGRDARSYERLYVDPYSFDPRSVEDLRRLRIAQRDKLN